MRGENLNKEAVVEMLRWKWDAMRNHPDERGRRIWAAAEARAWGHGGVTIVHEATGELSLTGRVLPIGGLKEKTIAARRNKAKHIIIPKQNEQDLDDIPDYVKKGIEFHTVERFEEVLALALPD